MGEGEGGSEGWVSETHAGEAVQAVWPGLGFRLSLTPRLSSPGALLGSTSFRSHSPLFRLKPHLVPPPNGTGPDLGPEQEEGRRQKLGVRREKWREGCVERGGEGDRWHYKVPMLWLVLT